MRKYLSALAVTACSISVFATDARVETMGNTQSFMKDDQSIFVNPATVAQYDRMLMGSFGLYTAKPSDNLGIQYNRDASKPYFGGTVSLGKSDDDKSKVTLGAVLNRYDPMLKYIDTSSKYFIGNPKGIADAEFLGDSSLVSKIDLMSGITLKNGFTVGLGGYIAFQSEKRNNVDQKMSRLVKGNVGISGKVADNMDLEAAVSVGTITLEGLTNYGTKSAVTSDNDLIFSADIRTFAEVPAINGHFVPHIQANVIKHHSDEKILDFNGGVGLNAGIDRGFVWGGIEGIYQNDTYCKFSNFKTLENAIADTTGERNRIGGRISFGVERNILTDWLVWRVGGSKLLAYEKLQDGNIASYWVENDESDLVSFGMGVNIEDRFHVDAVVSENMLYTFSNLFSGNSHHFSSKISATFAF